MSAPSRTIEIAYPQDSYGLHLLARLYQEGWETLEPMKYFGCCGLYVTTLYLPDTEGSRAP